MALLNTWASQQDQATLSPLDRLLNNYIQKGDAPLSYLMRGDAQGLLKDLNTPKPVNMTQDMANAALNLNPVMGLIGATAFHGSPYLFDKFDIGKVGRGEGAQAYGHGMYFAENPKVAEEYKNALKFDNDLKITTNGDVVTQKALTMSNMDKDKAISMLKAGQVDNVKMPESFANYMVENTFAKMQNPSGTLYKVDIPDTSIPKMLEWDKSLSAQNKEIQPAINQALDKIKKLGGEVDKTKMTGKDLYFRYQQYRGNNPDFASEGLKDMGIYGIRYLDEGSREAGKGTNNFVVFDPSNVKILERNNKGLLK